MNEIFYEKPARNLPLYADIYTTKKYFEGLTMEQIINKQQRDLVSLSSNVQRLEKENMDLRKICAMNDHCEKELKKANEKIKQLQDEKSELRKTSRSQIFQLENKIKEVERKKEVDFEKYRKNLATYHQKIDFVNQIELENQVNKEEIEDLKQKNEKLKKETEDIIRNKEIKNQIKYSQLKKKMVESLQETKSSVTKLNLEYMDVSNKLTLLQNHQLIVQIEYQAQKIEELSQAKEILEKKMFELEKELEVHKEVELTLADRVRALQETGQNASPISSTRSKGSGENKIMELISKNDSLNRNDSATYIFNQEKKIKELKKIINSKKEECERIKINANEYKEKVQKYEKRYGGLFNFFEDCLNLFFKDEELNTKKDLYINIEQIKKCDFTAFSSEQKYSLLVLLMKYLLPIVSLNLNSSCNIGNNLFETNLNLINRRYNMTEKYLHDPCLRRAFVGKNNKISSDLNKNIVSKFSNSIPVLRKTKSEIDPRLTNSRYKAIF